MEVIKPSAKVSSLLDHHRLKYGTHTSLTTDSTSEFPQMRHIKSSIEL